ncbi:MAG: hypothetical protein NTW94_05335 [Legionellales bacterium]|nr:hypothetical protein [Legionellales bacterium]
MNKVVASKQGEQPRALVRGAPIFINETIVTGAHSSAQIKYSNGTLVSIQPDSHYLTLANALSLSTMGFSSTTDIASISVG